METLGTSNTGWFDGKIIYRTYHVAHGFALLKSSKLKKVLNRCIHFQCFRVFKHDSLILLEASVAYATSNIYIWRAPTAQAGRSFFIRHGLVEDQRIPGQILKQDLCERECVCERSWELHATSNSSFLYAAFGNFKRGSASRCLLYLAMVAAGNFNHVLRNLFALRSPKESCHWRDHELVELYITHGILKVNSPSQTFKNTPYTETSHPTQKWHTSIYILSIYI